MHTLICLLLLLPAGDWPGFRGKDAGGHGEGKPVVTSFDGETGKNLLWKTPVPGLAHASPIVWGDQVILASAVGPQDDPQLKLGLYGAGDAADDMDVHRWTLTAYNKKTGEQMWASDVHTGKPRAKRHIKATHCNATPFTDGRYIVSMMGSEGLFCTDMQGKLLWHVDLGHLDVGAYDLPEYEWGPASSPIIYKDMAIVQVDTSGDDFIAAYDLASGKQVWRTKRDEVPGWATPTVYTGPSGVELVTNGGKRIRGYNPTTGEELWTLGGSSNITAPTPIFTEDTILIASGRRPVKPIFALNPGAKGDITLGDNEKHNNHVRWNRTGVGSYMPTPVIVDDLTYVLNNDGVLRVFDLANGDEVYKKRMAHGGSGFSASPVVSGDTIIFSGEDGDIHYLKAGRTYSQPSLSELGETLMATPAISNGILYLRGRSHLFAIGKKAR